MAKSSTYLLPYFPVMCLKLQVPITFIIPSITCIKNEFSISCTNFRSLLAGNSFRYLGVVVSRVNNDDGIIFVLVQSSVNAVIWHSLICLLQVHKFHTTSDYIKTIQWCMSYIFLFWCVEPFFCSEIWTACRYVVG